MSSRSAKYGYVLLSGMFAFAVARCLAVDLPMVSATYEFKVTVGKDLPVCRAYVERLRQTQYTTPPYCDRPEPGAPSDFKVLNRVPLTYPEAAKLWPHVTYFTTEQRQASEDALLPQYHIDRYLGTRLVAWKYSPEVDIDNDGVPDDVLIWRGTGLNTLGDVGDWCGQPPMHDRDPPGGVRLAQLAFILEKDGVRIDEQRTHEIFGNSDTQHELPSGALRELGSHVGIFNYRSTYYIDTFYNRHWGDFRGQRRDQPALDDTLGVFLRKGGRTDRVCEIRMTQELADQ
jgi:hypothetical protein